MQWPPSGSGADFRVMDPPSPTFAESKIRNTVLTGMHGRIGGNIAALGAHLGRPLIFGATATGAATTVAPRAGPVFGEGRRRWVKFTKTLQKSASEPPGGHCTAPGDSHTRLPALYALPVEKIVFDGQ